MFNKCCHLLLKDLGIFNFLYGKGGLFLHKILSLLDASFLKLQVVDFGFVLNNGRINFLHLLLGIWDLFSKGIQLCVKGSDLSHKAIICKSHFLNLGLINLLLLENCFTFSIRTLAFAKALEIWGQKRIDLI